MMSKKMGRGPDKLARTGHKSGVELRESELGRVIGGATSGAGAGKVKFNEFS